jgi:hypothetical protein
VEQFVSASLSIISDQTLDLLTIFGQNNLDEIGRELAEDDI